MTVRTEMQPQLGPHPVDLIKPHSRTNLFKSVLHPEARIQRQVEGILGDALRKEQTLKAEARLDSDRFAAQRALEAIGIVSSGLLEDQKSKRPGRLKRLVAAGAAVLGLLQIACNAKPTEIGIGPVPTTVAPDNTAPPTGEVTTPPITETTKPPKPEIKIEPSDYAKWGQDNAPLWLLKKLEFSDVDAILTSALVYDIRDTQMEIQGNMETVHYLVLKFRKNPHSAVITKRLYLGRANDIIYRNDLAGSATPFDPYRPGQVINEDDQFVKVSDIIDESGPNSIRRGGHYFFLLYYNRQGGFPENCDSDPICQYKRDYVISLYDNNENLLNFFEGEITTIDNSFLVPNGILFPRATLNH